MRKAIQGVPKKRGRPKTTGRGAAVNVRLHPPELNVLDAWARAQADKPSRARALWRLALIGLDADARRKQ